MKTHKFDTWHAGMGIVRCTCGSWSTAYDIVEARRVQESHAATANDPTVEPAPARSSRPVGQDPQTGRIYSGVHKARREVRS